LAGVREQRQEIGLRALRSFHAIVRNGSVTSAAREMGLSQPAVSRILAGLEDDIGFELFHRDRGRLVPTADGLLLFEEVDVALGHMDRVHGAIRNIAEFRTGELKLVAPPSFSEGILSDIASDFLRQHPNIRLTIDSRSVETAKSLIATRAVDGGFVKLPLDRPDLCAEKIVTSETIAVMATGHPLASRSVVTPQELKGEPLVLLGLGRTSRAQVETSFAERGVKPIVRVETHTIGSACALAARGVGIALVNELLARSYLGPALAVCRFSPRLVHEYAFVTSALTKRSRLAEAFLEHARGYFEQSGAQTRAPAVVAEPITEAAGEILHPLEDPPCLTSSGQPRPAPGGYIGDPSLPHGIELDR
jgi:DNA-binding transcriptional LysR family regulator